MIAAPALILVLLSSITDVIAKSVCGCSGHGTCDENDPFVCNCDPGYDVVADCSQMRCPYGHAWTDKAYNRTLAHMMAECSNQGLCNRKTGQCDCMPGFEGQACQKLSCGSERCSDNGVCLTISQLYTFYTPYASGAYDAWDADQATMCVCFPGYTGPACEMRMCPKGVDPLTTALSQRTIRITTTAASGTMSGYFRFYFNNYYFDFPAHGSDWDQITCQQLVQSMSNVAEARCIFVGGVGVRGQITFDVEFRRFPTRPVDNNIFYHDGNPPLSSFNCVAANVTGATSVACAVTDRVTTDIPGIRMLNLTC
jgi:hypothetical protein